MFFSSVQFNQPIHCPDFFCAVLKSTWNFSQARQKYEGNEHSREIWIDGEKHTRTQRSTPAGVISRLWRLRFGCLGRQPECYWFE